MQENDLRNIAIQKYSHGLFAEGAYPQQGMSIFYRQIPSLSTNDKHEEEIGELYKGIQKLQPESDLPDLVVTNMDNQKVSLKEISRNKKTVFYFWSASQKGHFRNVHKRISKLQKKYPDHNFVGINVKTGYPQWQEHD